MITVNHLATSLMARIALKAKTAVQHLVRALMDAGMRRIHRELEFHRRLNEYRRARDPLGPEGWRGRF